MVQLEPLSMRETGVSDRFPMADVPEKWMQAYAGGGVSTIRRYDDMVCVDRGELGLSGSEMDVTGWGASRQTSDSGI